MKVSESALEKDFQDLIANSQEIKNGIIDVLILDKSNYKDITFEKEVKFINGITADFTLTSEDKLLLSTVECKRADIGVTEYVRGVGQLLQYEYFYEQEIIPHKFSGYRYLKFDHGTYPIALIIPSDFYKNTKLNIGLFKYPKTSKIIEINVVNHNVREITQKILSDLANKDKNTISISSYYLRDNRLFEYYLLIKYINYQMSRDFLNSGCISRREAESHLKKINTVNNGNWRNAFITLSSLGFIDSRSYLTTSGKSLLDLTFSDFVFEIYNGYIKPYVDTIIELLEKQAGPNQVVSLNNQDIIAKLKEDNNGNHILFLTESDGRYISSWMNILRDDFGCVYFESRNKNRTLHYVPSKLSESELKRQINSNFTKNEKIQEIFKKFEELLDKGEFNN